MIELNPEPQNREVCYSRRWQRAQVAKGLCRFCSSPIESGGACLYHKARDRVARAERYRRGRNVAIRFCSKCGQPGHNRRTCATQGLDRAIRANRAKRSAAAERVG